MKTRIAPSEGKINANTVEDRQLCLLLPTYRLRSLDAYMPRTNFEQYVRSAIDRRINSTAGGRRY